ncbi:MAG: hypothetical protein AB7G87_01260 [Clostridia bacterium]
MTGKTFLILRDLKDSVPVKTIASLYGVTTSAVYKLAERYNVPLPNIEKTTEEERKRKKSIADAKRYEKEKAFKLERPDVLLPIEPMTVSKRIGLGALNEAWIMKEGQRFSSSKEHKETQKKYGLRT